MNKTVVGLGEILWDVFPEGKVLGGAPANFAYHASQLGCEGCAVSAIGRDEAGDEIVATLTGKGLARLIERVDFPTGTVQVSLDGAGVPHYEICEGVAWDNIPFGPKTRALAEATSAVCFGSLAQRSAVSRRSIKKFIETMPADSLKIFDINLRQHFYSAELIDESLRMANILKINDDEAEILSELFGLTGKGADICSELLDRYGLKLVILTCGSVGSHVFDPGGEVSHLPTPKVEVADTVGAGDSFTAAFIAAWMHGRPIAVAHELAVEVAAWVCTRHGAMPELPVELVARFR